MIAALAAALLVQTAPGLIEKASPYSVPETLDRLERAAENAGATVFARIDHQDNAEAAGLDLAPVSVLIFGNAQMGTPFMAANPRAGLDLPVRVVAFEENGETIVAYLAPDALAARYGVGEMEAAARMGAALERLTNMATAAE